MMQAAVGRERQGFFVFLNLYRWVNWLLALVLLYLGAAPAVSPEIALAAYGSVFLYNGAFTLWPRAVESQLRRRPYLIAGDWLFCTALIFVYGWASPFYVYSFSPIMLAGYLFGLRGGFLVAALGAIGYHASTAINGLIWAEIAERGMLDAHLFQMFDYFLVAIFFTYPAVLAERLRRSNAELHEAHEKIERLTLDKERQRMAGEIHDGVTQSLMGVNLLIDDSLKKTEEPEVVERLTLAKEAAGKAIEHTRLAINDLFEQRFSHRPLSEIAGDVLDDLGRMHNLRVSLLIDGEESGVPLNVKKNLYMIFQEAVGNIVKHADATQVEVRLRFEREAIQMRITDDGTGFDPRGPNTGYGLATISQRAQELCGKLEISSAPLGQGTNILLTVPRAAKSRPNADSALIF